MNHHHRNDDPYYHQSTSAPSTSATYSVYNAKLSSDQEPDDTLPSIVEADQMNAFMDDYLDGMDSHGAHSKPQHMTTHHRSTHDEDLEELLKETDDMKDIQHALQQEHIDMADNIRIERSRKKRAAAARSRYQRMSENERKEYNHRRRLRTLGVDPNAPEAEQEAVRAQLKEANARKAEAARQRYHRMTPEQKRDYNHRRTQAFRRRRQEEEALLSTPAGRISQEALAKAHQIMVRNARKAESARIRYQKMTPEQRRTYNMKRATSKKTRRGSKGEEEDYVEYQDSYMDSTQDMSGGALFVDDEQVEHDPEDHIDSDIQDNEEEVVVDDQDHLLHVINQVAHPPNELGVFEQMESDVIRRTKKANATIMKQSNNHHPSNNIMLRGLHYDLAPSSPETLADAQMLANLAQIIEDPNHKSQEFEHDSEDITLPPSNSAPDSNDTHVIDEKALHDMVTSGHDMNGLPVEIRTVDGQLITSLHDLINISHGQTVLITQRVVEQKPPHFLNDSIPHPSGPSTSSSTTTTMIQNNLHSTLLTSSSNRVVNSFSTEEHDEFDYEDGEDEEEEEEEEEVVQTGVDAEQQLKIKKIRARRAERARARYHRMSSDKRKEQNARRALALREARARDDELLRIADSTPFDQIDPTIFKAIQDAQNRRNRRAEQARSKYRKMTDEERKIYNQSRDQQRRGKKVPDASSVTTPQYRPAPTEQSASPPVDQVEASSFFY